MQTDQSAATFVENLKTKGITRAFAFYTDPISDLEKILIYDDGTFLLLDVEDRIFKFLSANTAYLIIERMNRRVYHVRGMGAFKKPLDHSEKEALRYDFHRR